ncbi:MAG: hypothetical protein AAF492_22235, partial [Verrucomicrobiota bacterium]
LWATWLNAASNAQFVCQMSDPGLGEPTLNILTPDIATLDLSPVTIAGVHNEHVVGSLTWSNLTTGASGTFAAGSPWTSPMIPVVGGTNLIEIRGSNLFGQLASDTLVFLADNDCNTNGVPDSLELDTVSGRQDFSGGPGMTYQLNGAAIVSNGACRVAPAVIGQSGSVIFEPISTNPVVAFETTFDFRIGGGNGADGMAFALMNEAVHGPGALFSEGGPGGSSLSISFDTYLFDPPSGNHVDIRLDGVVVTSVFVSAFTLNDDRWHHAGILFDQSNLTVTLTPHDSGPIVVIDQLPIPGFTPFVARTGFGARSGGVIDNHWVDNYTFRMLGYNNDINSNGIPDACDVIGDNDNDGIPDPIDPDDDNDGVPDAEEFVADTDPLDDTSFLWLGVRRTTTSMVQQLLFPSSSRRNYFIQYKTNLFDAIWMTELTNLPGTGGLLLFPRTNMVELKYYRIGVEIP